MPIPVFFLLLLLLQIVFLPGLLTQGEKVSNPHRTIIAGGSYDNPPYEYLDENGEPAGYNVALTKAVATEMGVDVEIRLDDKKVMFNELLNGNIDIVQGVMETETTKGDLLFTPHTLIQKKVFSHSKEDVEITLIDQLKGKKIVVKRNGIMHKYLIQTQSIINPNLVNTHADALRLVALGQYDYALVANLSNLYLKRHLEYLEKDIGVDSISLAGELLPVLRYGYVSLKNKNDLIDSFSDSLHNLEIKGLKGEIHDRWLGSSGLLDLKNKPQKIQIGELIFSPLILIICSVVFWNRSLKREVERRSTELALQQLQLQQADKMAMLGTLVSGVAHEINNPTGLILFNLSVLENIYRSAEETLEQRYQDEGDFFIGGLRYSMLREESSEVFTELKGGAIRIKQIVDDLKDFSRNDNVELDELVNLNTAVDAAVRLVKGSIKKITCEIKTNYMASIPEFIGSQHRIEQVIINLLLNASQALTSPQQKISIWTSVDKNENEIILSVSDEGVGIEKDQIPKLTDPFYTTKREQGGTGLGLSVSAGIVAEHQGRLLFDSELGIGTTVSICLPIRKKA
jgi:signal transduction histidine kinase